MYGLCHVLWRRRIPFLWTLPYCAALSYILGAACSAASILAEVWFGGPNIRFRWDNAFAGATGGSFVLLAWSALYFGVKHYQTIEDQHSQLLASQALARDAQLEALRYQLQPHFLFNTLNAISSLVITKQTDTAAEMIARLAGLLRSTLSSPERHAVTLREELEITQEYLSIEEARFGPRLTIVFDISPQTQDKEVPRFLLQPLVENAIRHGIAKLPQGGEIVIRSLCKESMPQIEIESDQIEGGTDKNGQGYGLGLANTRKRLHTIYGTEGVVAFKSLENRFVVSLQLPLRKDMLLLPSVVTR
jgi:LytS/YehU family sensor histidine kinase